MNNYISSENDYDTGYTKGVDEGYDQGYDVGKTDGFEEGYRYALKEHTDDIEERGYKEGFATATSECEQKYNAREYNYEIIIKQLEDNIKKLMDENFKLRMNNGTNTNII